MICLCPEVVRLVFESCGKLFAVHVVVVVKVDVGPHEAPVGWLSGPQVTSQGRAGVISGALQRLIVQHE